VKKKLIVVVVIVAAAAAAFIYWRHKQQGSNHQIKVSGNIEATDIRLSFQVGGKLVERLVDEGDSISRGQVLARLDKEEHTKIEHEAQANLNEAQATFQNRQKDYERISSLFKDDAVSAQERDTAQKDYDVAQAQLQAARDALELAGIRLGYTDLKSTIDGFVIVRSAEVGEVLQAGATVFTVLDMNDIWLTAYINETDLGRVKLGQAVDIKTDTYPGKTYRGHVSFISQEAEFTPKQIQTTSERVKLV
jgi:HlyD family secretion protein